MHYTMNGRWVLRDEVGSLIDFDRYHNDVIERNSEKEIIIIDLNLYVSAELTKHF